MKKNAGQVLQDAENLVRHILRDIFGQKVDEKTVKAIAVKVSRSVPSFPQKKKGGGLLH